MMTKQEKIERLKTGHILRSLGTPIAEITKQRKQLENLSAAEIDGVLEVTLAGTQKPLTVSRTAHVLGLFGPTG